MKYQIEWTTRFHGKITARCEQCIEAPSLPKAMEIFVSLHGDLRDPQSEETIEINWIGVE